MTIANRKFIIFTWGCQMNEDDSEQISGLLMQMGCLPAVSPEEADIAVLVTCSVRAKPEEKAKSQLGKLRILKETKPEMIIGVCGCMAQKEGEALRKGRPYLDFIVGTASIPSIPDLLRQAVEERRLKLALALPEKREDELIVPERVERPDSALKSFVPIMYGCDNFCSYCVVPYVRGRERSRGLDDVVAEVEALARNGRKEITLLGQNVNSYGATLDDEINFADLLRAVSEVDGIERIRFTTSHPKDLSDRLIEAMRDLPNVCEHIHLAVQSGDDDVLRRMNRKYTAAHYKDRVAALRAAIPDVAITTDFIAGFPGETDEQFQNTLRLVEEVRFDAAFMFAFNPIKNTAAEKLDGHLPNAIKNERLGRLIMLQNKITCEINDSQVGREFEVLVEGVSPKDPNRLTGLTRQNKTVNFPGDASLIGQLVRLRVVEGHLYGFVGELA
ncbi:MAG: tRNA (N6-isopentenyl adenosine(37)-C2)-methylthiotransferase MiaB [Armatimonadetes bacterium]|nr:tRNA (N6-isopentenyl adenosine(37)-C2)-methylthiotransferase MiaB [Armatimonadota bacterium]